MKKIIGILLLLGLSLFPSTLNASSDFRFDNESQSVRFIQGMEHRKINGKMSYKGEVTNQYYNYLSTGTAKNNDYHLVSVDAFVPHEYGMQPMNYFIEAYEKSNPHMEVLAGINGDYYQIQVTGQANNTHVRDYKVITPGYNTSVAFVTDNMGNHYFKRTVIEGDELIVYNRYNEVKYREMVDKINEVPKTNEGLTLLFDNFIGNVPDSLDPIYVKGTDIKLLTYKDYTPLTRPLFAEGFKIPKLEPDKIPDKHFVVISNKVKEIIEEGDKVIFQAKIKDYENVMSAISTYYASDSLIRNGTVISNSNNDRGPRTSIGIKENGEVIFLVADGRDRITPKHGFKIEEMARLMEYYGAVDAYNFDGGGSSTLMIRNNVEEGTVLERFDVVNDLSDGRLRSLSNGLLLVKGDLKSKPIDIRGIESRPRFNSPINIYIDDEFNLNFDPVFGAERYEIFINGLMIETTKTVVPIKGLILGNNKIEVRAKGTTDYMTSLNSTTLNYKVQSEHIKSLLNLIKKN